MATLSNRIVILGATGAVGGITRSTLLQSPALGQLTILARRALPQPPDSRETRHIVDTMNAESYAQYLRGHDTAICTMGVGQPSKVARDEFKRVDHDAVLDFAKACKTQGISHFVLLSSVGADATSRSYYLKSKGALRDAIKALGFDSVTTFQPSVIVTPENRYDWMQGVLLVVWPVISKLLVGGLSKYRGIPVASLGRAIAAAALSPSPGNQHLHWDDITRLTTA